MRILHLFLIASCFLLALDNATAGESGKSKKVIMRKTQNVDFDGDTVEGKGSHPDGAYVLQKRSVDFVPLYKVRDHFDDNIRASSEYIK